MSMPFSMPMCQMSLPFSAAPTILPPAPALLHLHKSFQTQILLRRVSHFLHIARTFLPE